MTDIPSFNLFNFFLFLFVPFVFAYGAKYIKLPPIIGYILGGIVLGNAFSHILSEDTVNSFAYFGIILLLFTVGLEINFDHLLRMRKHILLAGVLQTFITIGAILLISLLFHFSLLTSLLISLAFVSSSTILVAKILQDRGEDTTFIGELVIGILMFQDISFIPLLIIFNSLSGESMSIWNVIGDILLGMLKAGVIITLLFFLGKQIIPRLFDRIARYSRELLNVFIIIFIFFVTYLSIELQISVLVGVFIAGILVGQTRHHYHVFSQIRPLRDILAVVFFVFIGLNINLAAVIPMFPQILLFTVIICFVKISIILAIFLALRFHTRTAFTMSILLFQISESAFILMYSVYARHVIPYNEYLFITTSVVLSLILTPFLLESKEHIYTFLRKFISKRIPVLEHVLKTRFDSDILPKVDEALHNHVVICGYGRVGRHIGQALTAAHIPFIAIDYNYSTVEKAKKQGVNIIYGDPTDSDILEYAHVSKAYIVVTATAEHYSQEAIVLNIQRLNPHAILITRVHRKEDGQRMKDLGVDIVVQPEFEASLSIIKKLLFAYRTSKEDIASHVKRLQMEHGLS